MTRRVAKRGKRGRKRDERLPNGSTVYWSRRFEDGQYANGETRWRVPVRCGQCGQVREVNTSTARRPKFSGLCSICAQIERTEDEELENGSIVYWSRQFKDGRYPGGRIHWRIPVRCGKCGRVRRVCTSTAQSQGFTGLCQSCTRVERTEDEELENGSIVYWSRRFKDGQRPSGRIHWRVPVRCGQCGQVREIDALTAQMQGFTGLCFFCAIQHQRTPSGNALKVQLRREHGRCQVCGLAEPDILVIHHKDGDRENNDESNLMVLCPNCHARIHRS